MRDIEFRGKRADGEWCYGNLNIKTGQNVAIITPDDTPLGKYGRVNADTVGQYTGMKDSSGKKIFEHDIVEFSAFDIFSGANLQNRGVVMFYNGAFWVFTTPSFEPSYDLYEIVSDEDSGATVIGNVHDEPELLPEYVPELLAEAGEDTV